MCCLKNQTVHCYLELVYVLFFTGKNAIILKALSKGTPIFFFIGKKAIILKAFRKGSPKYTEYTNSIGRQAKGNSNNGKSWLIYFGISTLKYN